MSGEPVASLEVSVTARIDRAERSLQAFEQQLDRTANRTRQTSEQIKQQSQQAGASARGTDQLTTSLREADKAMTGLERSLAQANKNAARTERDDQRLADAKIRAATSARDYGAALSQIEQEMQRAGAGSLRYIQLQDRQSQVFARATREVERNRSALGGLQQGFSGLQGALGAVGIGFGIEQLVRLGATSIASANNLERSKTLTLALAGSQERYNQVLMLATQGQARYGGSLQEQLDGLRGLIPVSNRANIELGLLDKTVRQLNFASPEQGIEGAAIAAPPVRRHAGGTGAGRGVGRADS